MDGNQNKKSWIMRVETKPTMLRIIAALEKTFLYGFWYTYRYRYMFKETSPTDTK
jgi:hypothetical protein